MAERVTEIGVPKVVQRRPSGEVAAVKVLAARWRRSQPGMVRAEVVWTIQGASKAAWDWRVRVLELVPPKKNGWSPQPEVRQGRKKQGRQPA